MVLQSALAMAFFLYGYPGCGVLLLLSLLPWLPLLEVGAYLSEPIIDWRARKVPSRGKAGQHVVETAALGSSNSMESQIDWEHMEEADASHLSVSHRRVCPI